ncbi:MAG: hypothetical protein JNK54_02255 [Elusimicrobia bacterium]|jgi:hypothetical protein|nr:hypothetical protein [Elusimicrobiota bacterium]
MESVGKIFIGLFLLGISLAYLYRPTLVLRVNAWARMFLFNDSHLLHYRRKWGLLALLGSVLFLYSGFLNLSASRRRFVPAPDPLLVGYQAFNESRFEDAAAIALMFLKGNPQDPHGMFLLRQSRSLQKKRP